MRTPDLSAPSSSDRMRRQRIRDTEPELMLRVELHARGMRYFVHRRPLPLLRREADIVFPSAKVAVFVDGCWWHGCPYHGSTAKTNSTFWREKIEGNRMRDRDTDERLTAAGWLAVRVWEHDLPSLAARDIIDAVHERRAANRSALSAQ